MDELGAASPIVELLPTRHPRAGRGATFYGLRVRRNDPRGLAGLLKGLLRFAPWRQDFEAELLRFPAGGHDDQVDALGFIGQMLDRIRPGHIAKPVTAAAEVSGYRGCGPEAILPPCATP